MRRLRLDRTLLLLLAGYDWLPGGGPEAARFFYDERHVRRHTALPEPVRSTLFGPCAVDVRQRRARWARLRRQAWLAKLVRDVRHGGADAPFMGG